MKVLVTGATGFLGNHVVRKLVSEGHQVRILIRPGADESVLSGLSYECAPGDILNLEAMTDAATGCDAIIHAAGKTTLWPTPYRYYEQVNVTGTENVLQAAKHAGIRRLIHVGTASSFGAGTREKPGTELNEFLGFTLGSGYMNSKYVAQQIVLHHVEKDHIPAVVVNPTFMLGPVDPKPTSGKSILMVLRNPVNFCSFGGRNFIDVRDAAAGICNALTSGRPGECYLLAHENLTYREFFRKVSELAGERRLRLAVPTPVIRLAGLAGSACQKITGRQVTLDKVNARLYCWGAYYSGKKAVEELNLPQTPVDIAIRDAIQWLREAGITHN